MKQIFMYSTKEAELIYYRKNFLDNSVEKIGTKKDLIKLIAMTLYNEYSLKSDGWSFDIFWYQNMTGKDGGICLSEKSFQYFTSKGNIIDIQVFREDAVKYVKEYGKPYNSTYRERSKAQGRTIHSGIWCLNKKNYPHMNYSRKMCDEEMKPFNSRKDKNRMKGWDKNYFRLCSCNWKDQTKYKKQWMHKAKAKDCKTIRTWMFEA